MTKILPYLLSVLLFSTCSDGGSPVPVLENLPKDVPGLEALLRKSTGTPKEPLICWKLYKQLRDGDPDRALAYLEQQESAAKKLGDTRYEGLAHYARGMVNRRQGHFGPAILSYLRAIDIFNEDKDLSRVADSFNNIGYVFLQTGSYEAAIAYFEKALKLYETIGDTRYRSIALKNIGICYYRKKNPDNHLARKSYLEAVSLQKEYDDKDNFHLYELYMQLGSLDDQTQQYAKALDNYTVALEYARAMGPEGAEYVANIGYYIAESYMHMGPEHFGTAMEHIEGSEAMNAAPSDVKIMVRRLNIAAELARRQGQYSEAVALLEEAMGISPAHIISQPLKRSIALLESIVKKRKDSEVPVVYPTVVDLVATQGSQLQLYTELDRALRSTLVAEGLQRIVELHESGKDRASLRSDIRWTVMISILILSILSVIGVFGYRHLKRVRAEKDLIGKDRDVVFDKLVQTCNNLMQMRRSED